MQGLEQGTCTVGAGSLLWSSIQGQADWRVTISRLTSASFATDLAKYQSQVQRIIEQITEASARATACQARSARSATANLEQQHANMAELSICTVPA